MSVSETLQTLIVAKLRDHNDVDAICGDRIYDNVPKKAQYPYVSLGPSDYHDDDSQCITGRVETMQIDCWSRKYGKLVEARRLADAVKRALHDQSSDMGVHALVSMRVSLVRVFRDPDGITAHGVVMVEATIEEG